MIGIDKYTIEKIIDVLEIELELNGNASTSLGLVEAIRILKEQLNK